LRGGSDFLGFQWDYLLSKGFLAIFLGSIEVTIWLFRELHIRLVFRRAM